MSNSTTDTQKVLALYLDGPMQAWGASSRFNRRTTLPYPTRSGVMGILAASMGIPRTDRDALAELAALHMEALSLRTPQRWTDYHTIGGGYDPDTERQHMPRKANAAKPQTVLTDREYLADARFGVLLSGRPELIGRCAEAVSNPTWGIWLGRKCCIAASPIFQGVFADRAAAVQHLLALDKGNEITRQVVEVERFAEGTDTLNDAPMDWSQRTFAPRRIKDDLKPISTAEREAP